MDELLTRDMPEGVYAVADVNSESNSEVPVAIWTAANVGQVAHGLWECVLVFRIVVEPKDRGRVLSDIYSLVRSWDEPGKGVLFDDQVGVEEVTDGGGFNFQTEVVMNGKHLLQFYGQFTLKIRDWS